MSHLPLLFLVLIVGAGAVDTCEADTGDDELSLVSVVHEFRRRSKEAGMSRPDAQRGHSADAQRGHSVRVQEDLVSRKSFESYLSTAQKREFLMAAEKEDGKWWFSQAQKSAVESSVFEPIIEQSKAFVESERLHFTVGIVDIHPFEVALYLDKNSPLWGNPHPSTEDLVGSTAGTTIVLKTTQELPRLVPVTVVTTFLRQLFLPYVHAWPGCTEADLDNLLEMLNSEGHPSLGTTVNIKIDNRGLEVDVGGRSKGRLDNTAITKAAVSMLMSRDSPVAGLRDKALTRVSQGLKQV